MRIDQGMTKDDAIVALQRVTDRYPMDFGHDAGADGDEAQLAKLSIPERDMVAP